MATQYHYVGYVVNVHDPLNFDIDLVVPSDSFAAAMIQPAESKPYHFGRRLSDRQVITGKAYRCRLRGVMQKQAPLPSTETTDGTSKRKERRRGLPGLGGRANKPLMAELLRRLYRSNGWVVCVIVGIDQYHRILVDIFDPYDRMNFRHLLFQEPFSKNFLPYRKDERTLGAAKTRSDSQCT